MFLKKLPPSPFIPCKLYRPIGAFNPITPTPAAVSAAGLSFAATAKGIAHHLLECDRDCKTRNLFIR
jgi:hypothetical protein